MTARIPWNPELVIKLVDRGASDRQIARLFGLEWRNAAQKIHLAIVNGPPKPVKTRRCLCCRKTFEHTVNRVCGDCKRREEWV